MSEDLTGDELATVLSRLDAIQAQLARIEQSCAEVRALVGPFAVPMSPDELLVQTLHHVKYLVPVHDMVMTPQLVVYRQWEPELSVLLPQLCPPGCVFVDVGANFGYFTCLLAARMGTTAGSKVIAVEPNPVLARLLRINIDINWSGAPARVEQVAVAAEPGALVLHVPDNSAANGSLAALPATIPGRSFTVQAVRLDDLLRDEERVDLLKIDVEGFEPAVMRGAVETLARPGLRLICEWSVRQMELAGQDPRDLLAAFRGAGFLIYEAEARVHTPNAAALDDETLLAKPYLNILCLKP